MTTPTEIVSLAAVVADPRRFLMLLYLDGPLPIGKLAQRANVSPATATHHVRRLEEVGLVHVHRRGRLHVVRRDSKRWYAIWRAFSTW